MRAAESTVAGCRCYGPLRRRTLAVQLVVLVIAEIALFRVYGSYDSRFHWGAHFLVGLIAAAGWLSGWLILRGAPAPGQIVTVLVAHLYAMAPDLVFRIHVPHAQWMNVFLGHIAVHYIPGGDRTWLALAAVALLGYCTLLSAWLRARLIEADAGGVPRVGAGGLTCLRPAAR